MTDPAETSTLGQSRRDRSERQAELERLARWLDTAFRVPGLGIQFGLDALLGLVPGLGDAATSLASLYILNAAQRQGVPRITLVRMALNILLETIVGAVPLVGDLFDVYWKSNRRNVELLRHHFEASPAATGRATRSDRWFVALVTLALAALMVAAAITAYWLLAWLVRASTSR